MKVEPGKHPESIAHAIVNESIEMRCSFYYLSDIMHAVLFYTNGFGFYFRYDRGSLADRVIFVVTLWFSLL